MMTREVVSALMLIMMGKMTMVNVTLEEEAIISMVTSSYFFCSPHLLPSSSTSLSRQLSSA